MAAKPHMRRWTDARDGKGWNVVFEPGVEEDPPTVRYARESLVFEGEGGPLHAPAVYGSDLQDLTDRDLQGLLDQAKKRRERERRTAGWGWGARKASRQGKPTR